MTEEYKLKKGHYVKMKSPPYEGNITKISHPLWRLFRTTYKIKVPQKNKNTGKIIGYEYFTRGEGQLEKISKEDSE